MQQEEKNKGGAPTKYKQEYCEEIVSYFRVPPTIIEYKREYYQNGNLKSEFPIVRGNEFPTFQGFADRIGVHVDTLHEWKEVHEEFSEAYMRAKQLQERIWLTNGMNNLYNSQFAQFFGKNCLGYKDKQEIEQSGELNNTITVKLAGDIQEWGK
jgi:hypothetical protein